jgi:hypothetical protein
MNPVAFVIKHFRFIMYAFCSKLACLFKLTDKGKKLTRESVHFLYITSRYCFIVQAAVITIVNYDHKTFIVQATGQMYHYYKLMLCDVDFTAR